MPISWQRGKQLLQLLPPPKDKEVQTKKATNWKKFMGFGVLRRLMTLVSLIEFAIKRRLHTTLCGWSSHNY